MTGDVAAIVMRAVLCLTWAFTGSGEGKWFGRNAWIDNRRLCTATLCSCVCRTRGGGGYRVCVNFVVACADNQEAEQFWRRVREALGSPSQPRECLGIKATFKHVTTRLCHARYLLFEMQVRSGLGCDEWSSPGDMERRPIRE